MKILASITLNLAASFAMPVVAAAFRRPRLTVNRLGWRGKNGPLRIRYAVGREPTLPAPVRNVLGIIGLGSALLGLIILYREWHT
jgi:hypothetical protein